MLTNAQRGGGRGRGGRGRGGGGGGDRRPPPPRAPRREEYPRDGVRKVGFISSTRLFETNKLTYARRCHIPPPSAFNLP